MAAPPRILGFDTATADTAAAVAAGDERIERTIGPAGGRPAHAVALLPAVEELVAAVGGWGSIDLIAVGIGPGSFTGLRIGIATARALAQSRALPVVGVATTSALLVGVAAAPAAAGKPPLAVIDARRGEVFAATLPGGGELGAATAPGGGQPAAAAFLAAEPVVCAPAGLPAALGAATPAGAVAGGDGAVRFRAEIEACGALVLPDGDDAHRLSASRICELAAILEPAGPERIRPLYLRRPDAERWRERHGSS